MLRDENSLSLHATSIPANWGNEHEATWPRTATLNVDPVVLVIYSSENFLNFFFFEKLKIYKLKICKDKVVVVSELETPVDIIIIV